MCPTRTSPTWRPTCPLRSRWTAAAAAAITRWLPRRYSPTTTSPRNKHLTRQGPPSGGPCSCDWTTSTPNAVYGDCLQRKGDGIDIAQGEAAAGSGKGEGAYPPTERGTDFSTRCRTGRGAWGRAMGRPARDSGSSGAPGDRTWFPPERPDPFENPPKTASDTKT